MQSESGSIRQGDMPPMMLPHSYTADQPPDPNPKADPVICRDFWLVSLVAIRSEEIPRILKQPDSPKTSPRKSSISKGSMEAMCRQASQHICIKTLRLLETCFMPLVSVCRPDSSSPPVLLRQRRGEPPPLAGSSQKTGAAYGTRSPYRPALQAAP